MKKWIYFAISLESFCFLIFEWLWSIGKIRVFSFSCLSSTVIPIQQSYPESLGLELKTRRFGRWLSFFKEVLFRFLWWVVGESYITKNVLTHHLEEVQPRFSVLAPTIRHVLFVVQLTVFKHRYHCTYIRLQGCRRLRRWYVDVCMLRYT